MPDADCQREILTKLGALDARMTEQTKNLDATFERFEEALKDMRTDAKETHSVCQIGHQRISLTEHLIKELTISVQAMMATERSTFDKLATLTSRVEALEFYKFPEKFSHVESRVALIEQTKKVETAQVQIASKSFWIAVAIASAVFKFVWDLVEPIIRAKLEGQ